MSRGRARGQQYHQDRLAEVWASPPPTQPGLVSPQGKARALSGSTSQGADPAWL